MSESKTQRRGLGRGLGSLIQNTGPAEPTAEAPAMSSAASEGSGDAPSAGVGDLAPVPGASFAELPVHRSACTKSGEARDRIYLRQESPAHIFSHHTTELNCPFSRQIVPAFTKLTVGEKRPKDHIKQ